jgi:riboflavin synthase alpha subunit
MNISDLLTDETVRAIENDLKNRVEELIQEFEVQLYVDGIRIGTSHEISGCCVTIHTTTEDIDFEKQCHFEDLNRREAA